MGRSRSGVDKGRGGWIARIKSQEGGNSISDYSEELARQRNHTGAKPSPKRNSPEVNGRMFEYTRWRSMLCEDARLSPLRPGCSAPGHCRPPYPNIIKISAFSLFPSLSSSHADSTYHITVDSFRHSMMKLFSRRAEIDLTRCWAPGLERSFRSFRIDWESAVVTDLQ